MSAKLCIVVPCYNESKRLNLERFLSFAEKCPEVHIAFANDGSKDTTAAILQEFCQQHPNQFLFLNYTENQGKAETIRKSFLKLHQENAYTHIAYLDADLSASPEELWRMFALAVQFPASKLIMGTRLRRLGASVTRSAKRHYLGRIFATLASMSLRLPVYDTQCGAKIVHVSVIPSLFSSPFVSKWFFDIELLKRLVLIPELTFTRSTIIEVPLNEWHAVDGSKVKLKDFLIAPLELLKIHRHYPIKELNYDTLSE